MTYTELLQTPGWWHGGIEIMMHTWSGTWAEPRRRRRDGPIAEGLKKTVVGSRRSGDRGPENYEGQGYLMWAAILSTTTWTKAPGERLWMQVHWDGARVLA